MARERRGKWDGRKAGAHEQANLRYRFVKMGRDKLRDDGAATKDREWIRSQGLPGLVWIGQMNIRFVVLSAFLMAVFTMGGTGRSDSESTLVLRPLSALVLGYGLLSLRREQILVYRWLFGVAIAWVAMTLVQVIPLPVGLADSLPGHGIVADLDNLTGLRDGFRTISLTPVLTRSAFWAEMGPLAVLVLGVQLSRVEQNRLLPLIILIGLASAMLGFMQILGDANGDLYLYQDTNWGLPVGFFANRNHQGVFLACLVPMLGVWWRDSEAYQGAGVSLRMVAALAAGVLLVPMILLTGSRTAVAILVLASLSLPLVSYRPKAVPTASSSDRRGGVLARMRTFAPFGFALVAVAVALAAVWVGRAPSLDRLFSSSVADDLRVQILPTVRAMIAQYWLLGSGLDSFGPVYRVNEPDSVLMPLMMNSAHDEWLELIMTAGIPGVLVLTAVLGLWLSRIRILVATARSNSPPYFVRLGFVIFLFYLIASTTDYHVRDASISCMLVVLAIWMVSPSGGESAQGRRGLCCANLRD